MEMNHNNLTAPPEYPAKIIEAIFPEICRKNQIHNEILSSQPKDDVSVAVQCNNCKHSHLTMEKNSDKLICTVEAWKLVKRGHGCVYGEPKTPLDK